MLTCCLCGGVCEGRGNNPEPLVVDDSKSCCDTCDDKFVTPARMKVYRLLRKAGQGINVNLDPSTVSAITEQVRNEYMEKLVIESNHTK